MSVASVFWASGSTSMYSSSASPTPSWCVDRINSNSCCEICRRRSLTCPEKIAQCNVVSTSGLVDIQGSATMVCPTSAALQRRETDLEHGHKGIVVHGTALQPHQRPAQPAARSGWWGGGGLTQPESESEVEENLQLFKRMMCVAHCHQGEDVLSLRGVLS